jgi:hypothetical protein
MQPVRRSGFVTAANVRFGDWKYCLSYYGLRTLETIELISTMDLMEMGFQDETELVHDRIQWWTSVLVVMNCWVLLA